MYLWDIISFCNYFTCILAMFLVGRMESEIKRLKRELKSAKTKRRTQEVGGGWGAVCFFILNTMNLYIHILDVTPL